MASLSSCFDTILVNKYWESVKTVILLIHLMTECICGKDLWQFSNEWGTILKYFKKLEKKFEKKKKIENLILCWGYANNKATNFDMCYTCKITKFLLKINL